MKAQSRLATSSCFVFFLLFCSTSIRALEKRSPTVHHRYAVQMSSSPDQDSFSSTPYSVIRLVLQHSDIHRTRACARVAIAIQVDRCRALDFAMPVLPPRLVSTHFFISITIRQRQHWQGNRTYTSPSYCSQSALSFWPKYANSYLPFPSPSHS